MNEDIIQGKWNELKGSIQEKWGDLTDDDMTRINGDRNKLAGTIQKNYGIARDEAEKQLKEWEDEHRV
ncbi:MAG: CsbD family protein [bacterium]|nr:CsbD family protein [bacterium]